MVIYSNHLRNMVPEFKFENLLPYLKKEIIIFKNYQNEKVVIKRSTKDYPLKNVINEKKYQQILEEPDIKRFLDTRLKEYFIAKIISANPAGLRIFGYGVTFLLNQNKLVFELMMEYAGESLYDEIHNKKLPIEKAFKYFIEIINIMKFFSEMKIAYCDVKLENFLVDSQGKIRIIDFDISRDMGLFTEKQKSKIFKKIGYSPGYVSPEILNMKNHAENDYNREGVDPFKADCYSCGIIGLILMNSDILDSIFFETLDGVKGDFEEHQQKINSFTKTITCTDIKLRDKIKYILSVCLNFNPMRRLNFHQLSRILEKIEDPKVSVVDIKKEIKFFLNEKHEDNYDELHLTINELQQKNRELTAQLKTKNYKLSQVYNVYKERINNKTEKILQQFSCNSMDLNCLHNEIDMLFIYICDLFEKLDIPKPKNLLDIHNSVQEIRSSLELLEKRFKNHKIENFKEDLAEIEENDCVNQNLSDINFIINNLESSEESQKMRLIPFDELRKEIQEKIDFKLFWDLHYLGLSQNEVYSILGRGQRVKYLKGIDFCIFKKMEIILIRKLESHFTTL